MSWLLLKELILDFSIVIEAWIKIAILDVTI